MDSDRLTPGASNLSRATSSPLAGLICAASTSANTGSAAFEVVGDAGTGTLTSTPFKVTQPWGSF
jgi:hypothetical protein